MSNNTQEGYIIADRSMASEDQIVSFLKAQGYFSKTEENEHLISEDIFGSDDPKIREEKLEHYRSFFNHLEARVFLEKEDLFETAYALNKKLENGVYPDVEVDKL